MTISTILITSGSGFLGAWVINVALARGYRVKTTVRTEAKGQYLAQLFSTKYGPSVPFSFVIVPDLETSSFDHAVQGVDAVLHTGSPFHTRIGTDPYKTLIQPAVQGTLNVLRAIRDHAPGMKRLVLTSSVAAVQSPGCKPGQVFDCDRDWNEVSVAALKQHPDPPISGLNAYRASKTLAERAAWNFIQEYKDQLPTAFDMCTINPTLVLGPIIHQVSSAAALNTSSQTMYQLFHGQFPETKYTPAMSNAVDVRDVALLHLLALEHSVAGGKRFPANWGPYSWQMVADAVHVSQTIPPEGKARVLPGQSGATSNPETETWVLDRTQSERLLGAKFRPLQTMVDSTWIAMNDYEVRGFKGIPDLSLLDLDVPATARI